MAGLWGDAVSLIATGVPVTQGTWTPSLGGNATYTTQTGVYTRIGRLVIFSGNLIVNVIGTGSTNAISGLPFVIGSNSTAHIGYFASAAVSPVFVSAYLAATQSTINIVGLTAAATGTGAINLFGNSTNVYFSGSYIV